MTQNEKDLLLRDLCARLPYGVKVQSTFYNCDGTIWKYENEILTAGLIGYPIKRYKPYLFPLSSMTEEQKSQYSFFLTRIIDGYDSSLLIDWLNRNYFDYRGLIKKGLAIDATGKDIY